MVRPASGLVFAEAVGVALGFTLEGAGVGVAPATDMAVLGLGVGVTTYCGEGVLTDGETGGAALSVVCGHGFSNEVSGSISPMSLVTLSSIVVFSSTASVSPRSAASAARRWSCSL